MHDPAALARRLVPGVAEPRIRLLSVGLASRTYRIDRDDASFVLRAAAGPVGPEFDPVWECRLLALAAAAGIAPGVLLCDAAAGLLITRWIDGDAWSVAAARSQDRFPQVAALLRQIHALPPPPPPRRVAPADWIRRYAGAADADLERAARARLAALARLDSGPPVVCHSDLHRLNLLDCAGRLRVLDWEYAHVADRFWDLAGWLSANDLGPGAGVALLAAYLDREANADEVLRLTLLGWLYDYVAYLWCGIYGRRGREEAGGAFTARAGELRARLA